MTSLTRSEIAQQRLDQILAIFKDEKLPEKVAEANLLTTDAPSAKWSIHNRLIMLLIGDTRDARSFNQWKEAGRNVIKHRKAFHIYGPVKVKRRQDNTSSDIAGAISEFILIGFRTIPVFRVEDTEGKALPSLPSEKELPALVTVAEKWGISTCFAPTMRGESGSYSPLRKEIRLCTQNEAVFFHELAHACHHKVMRTDFIKSSRLEREIVAELSSCVLSRVYGVVDEELEAKAFNYIKHHVNHMDPNKEVVKECTNVIAAVQKVVDTIIQEDTTN